MFVSLLYTSKLVPRPMSVWGMIGYVVLLLGSISEMFGHNDIIEIVSVIPGGLFEITLSVWLIVKGFNISAIGSEEVTTQYFYDYFYERAVDLDMSFVADQLGYLHREYEINQPLRRCSPRIKERVKEHFCNMQGVDRSELDDNLINDANFKHTCKVFVQLENEFRSKYREAIEKRIRWMELSLDNLDEI